MVRNITLRVLAYLLLLIVLVVATCYFCRKVSIFRGCYVNTRRGVLLSYRVECPLREPETGLLLSSLGER